MHEHKLRSLGSSALHGFPQVSAVYKGFRNPGVHASRAGLDTRFHRWTPFGIVEASVARRLPVNHTGGRSQRAPRTRNRSQGIRTSDPDSGTGVRHEGGSREGGG